MPNPYQPPKEDEPKGSTWISILISALVMFRALLIAGIALAILAFAIVLGMFFWANR